MTVQTIKFGREKFVVLKEKDYKQLKARATTSPTARKVRKLSLQERQDAGDGIESSRRMQEAGGKTLVEVRQKLGL